MKRDQADRRTGSRGEATRSTATARRLAAWLMGALLAAALPAQALVLGVTEGVTYRATDNQIEARFEPIADVLSKSLKQPVTIKVLSSYGSLRDALLQQQVDLVFIHPAHVALEATKSGNYKTVAWTAGFTEYKVSLLCKDPQPIGDWKSVVGKSMVTPDPDSITAVMTRALLREHGLQGTAVEVKTTRYQDAVPFYVENGFAVYGATAAKGVIKTWKDGGGKTCAESRPVPIKQWLVSSRLDTATAAAARDTLLNLSQTEIGKRALAVSSYSGFVPPSAETEKVLTAWLGL
jgi:phosphonate transport system substrate-binding protein